MVEGAKITRKSDNAPGIIKFMYGQMAKVVFDCSNNWNAYRAYKTEIIDSEKLKKGWPEHVTVTKKLAFNDWCNKYEELAIERIDRECEDSSINYDYELQREWHKYLRG